MNPTESVEMPIPFGISADTGEPLPGVDAAALADFQSNPEDKAVSPDVLAAKADAAAPHFGVDGNVEANELNETGWAVIFAASVDQKVKDALQPLLDLRKSQVGDESLFQIFEGDRGYLQGDKADDWLKRRGASLNVVEPHLGVPFYVMIVASPDEIPYEFQYGLDINWGVGRLWFETPDGFPDPDAFRQYAESVKRYEDEQKAVETSRQMAVFATRHDFDQATQLFASEVAEPLANGSGPIGPIGQKQKFKLQQFIGDPATRNTLQNIWTGAIDNGAPAVVFSGSHGMAFRANDPRQAASQGAILCQDWDNSRPVSKDVYCDASALPANAKVHGTVHFLFACYGAGWPKFDNFQRMENEPAQISPQPMVARLPQALLSHPNGGALAVLGHVERAWAHSFRTGSNPQIQGFRDVMSRMMKGDRLGNATDLFNGRWAALSTNLAEVLQDMARGLKVDPRKLANQWIARDDARNYILFGDPAVRLRVNDMPVLA